MTAGSLAAFCAALLALAALVVLALSARRVLLRRAATREEAESQRWLRWLFARAFQADNAPLLATPRADVSRMALVLAHALEQVSQAAAATLADSAAETDVESGIVRLARSKLETDRLAAARLVRHFPGLWRLARQLAASDASMTVRAQAVEALMLLGRAPSTRLLSGWMRLGEAAPHPSVRRIFDQPGLVGLDALREACCAAKAHPTLRAWAFAALARRDQNEAGALAGRLLRDPETPPEFGAAALLCIGDPLIVTQLHRCLEHAPDWRLREALCLAARDTYAVTLNVQVTRLASDPDWRVRTAALSAMKRLGGFDDVPIPPAMRAAQMAAFVAALPAAGLEPLTARQAA